MLNTDSSKDERSPVTDNMDKVNDNRDLSSNVELEPIAQETDEIVDISQ